MKFENIHNSTVEFIIGILLGVIINNYAVITNNNCEHSRLTEKKLVVN